MQSLNFSCFFSCGVTAYAGLEAYSKCAESTPQVIGGAIVGLISSFALIILIGNNAHKVARNRAEYEVVDAHLNTFTNVSSVVLGIILPMASWEKTAKWFNSFKLFDLPLSLEIRTLGLTHCTLKGFAFGFLLGNSLDRVSQVACNGVIYGQVLPARDGVVYGQSLNARPYSPYKSFWRRQASCS
jgi:hypothetical protein